jgi:hypothetical protein
LAADHSEEDASPRTEPRGERPIKVSPGALSSDV